MTGPGKFSLASMRTGWTRLGNGVDPFRAQGLARIGQAGLDVLGRDVVVLTEDVFFAVATRQEIDHQLHGDSSAPDHRLSHQDLRIYHDALSPVHCTSSGAILRESGTTRQRGDRPPLLFRP